MLAVSIDRPQDLDQVRKVMQVFSYPAALLSESETTGFGKPSALPITYVLDAEGIVRATLADGETVLSEGTLSKAALPFRRFRFL